MELLNRSDVLVSSQALLIALLLICCFCFDDVNAGNVSYDHRAILIDGQRRVFISGSIHYPRSTPEMWPDLVAKAKDGGLDTIQTYVFWNMHEPTQGTYNFEGRFDLVRFVKVVQQAGLYVHLRIGPYVCAEWNYGGFPVWLHYIPGIAFRTDNEPFKKEMQKFTSKIVEMMKEEQLFCWQGGPIFLAQIENEYGNVQYSYGAPGKAYTKWAAGMAVGLNTGVPWVMCQQADAPDPVGHTYSNGGDTCAAFLANYDAQKYATVHYNGQSYLLPSWSVSILPDCKNVVFNTAQINTQTSKMTTNSVLPNSKAVQSSENLLSDLVWEIHEEPIGVSGKDSFSAMYFLDQINTTKDCTDYLWYSTRILVNENDLAVNDDGQLTLSVHSRGHALHVFVNGELAGSASGNVSTAMFSLEIPVGLKSGQNNIDLLSMTAGLQNVGAFYETWGAGIDGPVTTRGLSNGTEDLSSQTWTYQIGLQGETLSLYSETGGSSGEWISITKTPQNKPMIWYKTRFNAPEGSDPVALDLSSMGKGQAWVNGVGIGRYWPTYLSPQGGCSSTCDYRGDYHDNKCFTNCGQPSQSRYHVPRSWLKPSGNTLVLFEEIGGVPSGISFVSSSVSLVCAHISESHPPPLSTWDSASKSWRDTKPEVRIDCGFGRVISRIKFASFGNPQGTCGNFRKGSCHAMSSLYTLRKACAGKRDCSVAVSNENFYRDPCAKIVKSLAVEVICSEMGVITHS